MGAKQLSAIARPRIEYCDWLIILLLYATPAMQFSLDRKRRSYERNRCSASDSVGLIFNRSLYYSSDYGSDYDVSENWPLLGYSLRNTK